MLLPLWLLPTNWLQTTGFPSTPNTGDVIQLQKPECMVLLVHVRNDSENK